MPKFGARPFDKLFIPPPDKILLVCNKFGPPRGIGGIGGGRFELNPYDVGRGGCDGKKLLLAGGVGAEEKFIGVRLDNVRGLMVDGRGVVVIGAWTTFAGIAGVGGVDVIIGTFVWIGVLKR